MLLVKLKKLICFKRTPRTWMELKRCLKTTERGKKTNLTMLWETESPIEEKRRRFKTKRTSQLKSRRPTNYSKRKSKKRRHRKPPELSKRLRPSSRRSSRMELTRMETSTRLRFRRRWKRSKGRLSTRRKWRKSLSKLRKRLSSKSKGKKLWEDLMMLFNLKINWSKLLRIWWASKTTILSLPSLLERRGRNLLLRNSKCSKRVLKLRSCKRRRSLKSSLRRSIHLKKKRLRNKKLKSWRRLTLSWSNRQRKSKKRERRTNCWRS